MQPVSGNLPLDGRPFAGLHDNWVGLADADGAEGQVVVHKPQTLEPALLKAGMGLQVAREIHRFHFRAGRDLPQAMTPQAPVDDRGMGGIVVDLGRGPQRGRAQQLLSSGGIQCLQPLFGETDARAGLARIGLIVVGGQVKALERPGQHGQPLVAPRGVRGRGVVGLAEGRVEQGAFFRFQFVGQPESVNPLRQSGVQGLVSGLTGELFQRCEIHMTRASTWARRATRSPVGRSFMSTNCATCEVRFQTCRMHPLPAGDAKSIGGGWSFGTVHISTVSPINERHEKCPRGQATWESIVHTRRFVSLGRPSYRCC